MTHEPRFNDAERRQLLDKLSHDDGVCVGCGYHSSLIESEDLLLTPGHRVCALCAAQEQYQRSLEEADGKYTAPSNQPAGTPRPGDGRHPLIRLGLAKKKGV